MKENVIFRDNLAISNDTKTVTDALPIVKDIANTLKGLGVKSLSIDEIIEGIRRYNRSPMTQNIDTVGQWVKELLVKQVKEPTVHGIPISREKFIDMVEVKGNMIPLEKLLVTGFRFAHDYPFLVKKCITINTNLEAEINSKHKELIEAMHTKKTSEPTQIEALELVQQLIGTISKIEQLATKHNVYNIDKGMDSPLHGLPYVSLKNGSIAPNPEYILKF